MEVCSLEDEERGGVRTTFIGFSDGTSSGLGVLLNAGDKGRDIDWRRGVVCILGDRF